MTNTTIHPYYIIIIVVILFLIPLVQIHQESLSLFHTQYYPLLEIEHLRCRHRFDPTMGNAIPMFSTQENIRRYILSRQNISRTNVWPKAKQGRRGEYPSFVDRSHATKVNLRNGAFKTCRFSNSCLSSEEEIFRQRNGRQPLQPLDRNWLAISRLNRFQSRNPLLSRVFFYFLAKKNHSFREFKMFVRFLY